MCPLATWLPNGARSMGWALPSSLEDCSSKHGKGTLSLERAELLQEEGNLALNLYGGQVWLGWGEGGCGVQREKSVFFAGTVVPGGPGPPKGGSKLE